MYGQDDEEEGELKLHARLHSFLSWAQLGPDYGILHQDDDEMSEDESPASVARQMYL